MSNSILIDKDVAQELAYGYEGEEIGEYVVVENKIIGSSRWSIDYALVVRRGDRFYASSYSVGATETQDESPFEYEGDIIRFDEVFPIEKTVIEYVSENPEQANKD